MNCNINTIDTDTYHPGFGRSLSARGTIKPEKINCSSVQMINIGTFQAYKGHSYLGPNILLVHPSVL